ncbi:28 kDa heat and acid-stable phosphoprotein-like [Gossypium australe]|uniref:28 kDa heat and acid-stable phosphoprotein-like n=1 Tax=Gossypium australe TaxID=47621 RepID=A0A5B6WC17_9ROSI|nr:28 kDa heat and acid-stable phosphoprotein-like [Gossypium australe]
MGRGKFKAKPTGQRHFSTPEEMLAGTSSRPRTFKRQEAAYKEEEESEEESGQESGEESEDETEQKRKGTQGVIEVNNPNLVKPKNLKARDLDAGKTTELSRREREELEKQRAHERYMRLQEQGKTEQARKDLAWRVGSDLRNERLALIRQQREEAAKKREEEKAAREQKKVEARK